MGKSVFAFVFDLVAVQQLLRVGRAVSGNRPLRSGCMRTDLSLYHQVYAFYIQKGSENLPEVALARPLPDRSAQRSDGLQRQGSRRDPQSEGSAESGNRLDRRRRAFAFSPQPDRQFDHADAGNDHDLVAGRQNHRPLFEEKIHRRV